MNKMETLDNKDKDLHDNIFTEKESGCGCMLSAMFVPSRHLYLLRCRGYIVQDIQYLHYLVLLYLLYLLNKYLIEF